MALTAPQTHRREKPPRVAPIEPEPVPTRHPLYEIADRARALETEIIGGKVGSTEVLVGHLLVQNMLIRGLIAVAIADLEANRG